MSYIKQLKRLLRLIRYRFFLLAGIFPYLLGASVAFHQRESFALFYFLIGLIGIGLVVIGVETFNEYFDSKLGTDRVFSLDLGKEVPRYVFISGASAFVLAFLIASYLTIARGPVIFLFAFLGFLAAAFYVGPPIRWAYRGLGELVIFLAYGPLMTMGSYYLQVQKIDPEPLLVSFVPGLLIFSLIIANEIPDFYQDRLVGKRNIVVRIGKEKAASLYQIVVFACFALVGVGVILAKFPLISLLAFLLLPLAYKNGVTVKRHYDCIQSLISTIRGTVILYLVIVSLLIIGYWI